MTVYVDIVFLENLFINYILLIGTGMVRKIKIKKFRIIISASIGSLFAIIELAIVIPLFIRIIIKPVISMIMVLLAFNPHSVEKMLKILVVFYLTTFITGGCAFGILFLIVPNYITEHNGTMMIKHPYRISIIAIILGFSIIEYSFKNNKRMVKTNDYICNLKIEICGKTIKTKAFIDSGNNLKDPITMEPVIIIEKDILKKILNIDIFEINDLEGGDNEIKIRWIPYKSIGRKKGFIMGLKAEKIEIQYEEEDIIINNGIVGLYNGKINKYYSALVGLDLINN